MRRPYRLLTIGHSYAVALNRRLAQEMARAGGDRWDVTAVAPAFFHGDLRPVPLEACAAEPCRLEAVRAYFSRRIHLMVYGRRVRAVLREPWDLVHCWEEPYILPGGQVAWWTPGRVPLVYTTFQNIAKRYPPPFRWIERYALRRAAAWVAGGHTVDQALRQKACYRRRARRIIPLGVDVQQFRPDPEAGAAVRRELGWTPAGPPVVGYSGRFVTEKGLPLLLRVLDGLKTPWRALFLGGGPLTEHLRGWGRRHGDRVRVVTGIEHARVPAYLNAMDVLCAPSQTVRSWREQFGRMLVEAFACGVPVVASDSGEIPHVVGDAGVVAPEKDERAWAAALWGVLEDYVRRRDLAARGLARARTTYAWPVVARHYLRFFGDLLGSGN